MALPELSGGLFAALLAEITPSAAAIRALADAALAHPLRREEVFAALRQRLVAAPLASDDNRALWYLLDALVKGGPLLFAPLVAPRLVDLVTHHMPWQLATAPAAASWSAASRWWCDELVRSWADAGIPAATLQELARTVLRLRGGRELEEAGEGDGDGGDVRVVDVPATQDQLARLHDEWADFDAAVRVAHTQGAALAAAAAVVVAPPPATATASATVKKEAVAAAQQAIRAGPLADVNVDDEDIEYVPSRYKPAHADRKRPR